MKHSRVFVSRLLQRAVPLIGLWMLIGCSAVPPQPLVQSSPSAEPAPATIQPTVPPLATTQPTPLPDGNPDGDAPSTWTIGLLDAPSTLLPFSPDGRAAAPVVEALFPAPALGLSYAYTTTGVLETLPTLANGDVITSTVTGFLDATGEFTTTETATPTTTQQLTITYRWNDELRWADGTPLTAADSVFSFELYGQVDTTQAARAAQDLVERYEQVDDHTTRAVLKPGRVDPAYIVTAWPPLPRHLLADRPPQEALDEFKQQPLGYGPFTFAEQLEREIVLTRNAYWPDAERLPERLLFRFFDNADELRRAVTSGDVDAGTLERVPPDLFAFLDQDQQSDAAEVTYLPGPVYEHLDFNLADQRLQDVRVRQAIAYAINRQGMSDAVFGGKVEPLHSWILPEQRAFYAGDEQLTRYSYNPDRARALLDEAGVVDNDGDGVREAAGQPFALTLLTTDTSLRVALAQRVADDLNAIGMQVTVEPQPVDQFFSPTGSLFRRTFEVVLFGWIADVEPGGVPLWSCSAVPIPENNYTGNNFSGWCFEAAEWPIRRATNTLDSRVRAQAYLEHQRLWTQEVPVVPLLQRPLVVIAQPQVQGLAPDPLAPITWNIAEWRRGTR